MTQIQFGYGTLSSLQQACDRTGITQPLIVTDSVGRRAGIIAIGGGLSIDLAKVSRYTMSASMQGALAFQKGFKTVDVAITSTCQLAAAHAVPP